MKYVFYGDLLGIASAYRLSADAAYRKLDNFYNAAFDNLAALQAAEGNGCEVFMFSDSLFISGSQITQAIEDIGTLYSNLLKENLFLRGAIVEGELKYDVRVTRAQFEKQLPENDTLARATGLGKAVKGARFVIENKIVQKLFRDVPDWMTHEGYDRNASKTPAREELLRKICPTPASEYFEYLFYWTPGIQNAEFKRKIDALELLMGMKDEASIVHYKETIELLKRCEIRKNVSDRAGMGT